MGYLVACIGIDTLGFKKMMAFLEIKKGPR